MGIFGFWSLGLAISAVACGSSFDSEDCRASRTCAQAGAGMGGGGAPPNSAGAPAGGDDTGQPEAEGGAGGSPAEPETVEGGAGGEGGAIVVAMNPPPTVVSVSPMDAAPSVEPDAVIQVTFSEPLAPDSAKAGIKLLDRGKEVLLDAVPLSAADTVVTLKPARPLALLAEYEVSVTTAVTDAEGEPLAEAYASKFTVRDGKFYVDTVVNADVQLLANHVPVESNGSVLLTWTAHMDGQNCPVNQQRFLRGASVGPAQPLSVDNQNVTSCGLLTAAASPAGISAVTWGQFSDDPQTGHVRQYRDGSWSADVVPTLKEAGSALNLGISPDGTVSLFQNVTGRTYVYRTNLAGEWSGMQDDLGETGSSSSATSISYDKAGNGLAVWAATASDAELIYYSLFNGDTRKWSKATAIPASQAAASASDGYRRGSPALSMDLGGNAVALWVEVNGTSSTPRLMFSQYNATATSKWTKAKQLATSVLGSALYDAPAVVFDGQTFVAAFTGQQGKNVSTFVTRFDSTNSVWSTPEKRNDSKSSERMPKLVTGGRGDLLLVYPTGASGSYDLYFQRYAKDEWSPGELVAGKQNSPLYPWSLSSNTDGLVAVAWGEDDGLGFSTQKIRLASFY